MTKSDRPIDELLKICSPSQWKNFVFEALTTSIISGNMLMYNDNTRSDFIIKIEGLYNYFAQLEQGKE